MPTERVRLPGGRDVRASLDRDGDSNADAVVVACPPHPQHGGTRHDSRLGAVSDALPPRIDCLRFDYGPWDEGRGERADARTACAWAADRYARVGLCGYSFGGGVAITAAAETENPAAVAALAPVSRLPDGSDIASAVAHIDAPLWVGVGTRDETVEAETVAAAARERGGSVATFEASHAFVGQERDIGERVAAFVTDAL
ncbi:dienelactone hydrolase family protein [Haloplanus halobius]|uniref:dienelactone hydrolase family protein n=1 Tax=Haloplanus halobius TaxID=2934938 RepID=UPI00200EFC0E|nr:dienelactone hydrolase family protein [Haloplanus sp. XH21]